MEKRTDSPYDRRDGPVLFTISIALVVSTVLFFWFDRAHDWRYYQHEFRRMVRDQFGDAKAAEVPSGIQQVWIQPLQRADRCMTCHQAISWKGFEQAEQPWRTHPAEPLRDHPVERFGCSSCHGGQGWAIDTDAAHGEIAHWEEPLLSSWLGESYSLMGERTALMQMNCNLCHRYERETRGMAAINLAKRLVQDKGCRACHVIHGRGGTIGPDLTYVGDKAPEQYEYGRLSGQRTAFAWHVAHFKDPRALVEDTVMPNFHLTTEQAQALTMLMLSWRKTALPAAYQPGAPRTDAQSAEEQELDRQMQTGPGAWFVKTGCFVCHSIGVFGVRSPAQIGPDLSTAVEDVQTRFGVTIDDFLRQPTGTMAVVLSRQIVLSPQEKAVAVDKLREAFAEHQRQQGAAAGSESPSPTPSS